MLELFHQNDLLMWAMEEAHKIGHPRKDELLIQAVLAANFAAIHTSSAVLITLASQFD